MEGSENSGDATALGDTFFTTKDGTSYVLEAGPDMDDGMEESERSDNEPLKEQDRFLPIANVARIMKNSIPKTGKVAKDAKECLQECVSEFISFITSEASERCRQEKRKTINGEDILFAMSTLGFDNYVEPLKVYLQKYREATKGDKCLGPGDGTLEELGTDESFTTALTGNILTDQTGQQNVIYTTAYPTQLTQNQLNFG
ncbi:hypothetical protein NP493_25g00026 [Ridgeia piscesae]|uniref:Nuclear transcription factor Y subunit beta n=1 Tax=Ridgeia piscesae TaxID=27915 RepID=A0AAD9PDJ5_RIDPI|nr:hypothetical protein NP493_25g00026 [Ridgeia piscesae]